MTGVQTCALPILVAAASSDACVQADGPVLTNLRHANALAKARASLGLAQQSVCDTRPADLVAVDVQDAIDHIGEITGAITNEQVLDRIFSEFCVGK